MSQFTIRSASPGDLETICAFNQALARESEGRELDPERLEQGVRAVLDDPAKGRYWLAEADGEPVGQLMLTWEWSDWRNGYFWWIQSVYVTPQMRRSGVFGALCRHVEKEAGARSDVCGLRLYVERENEAARAVYDRLGIPPAAYEMREREL